MFDVGDKVVHPTYGAGWVKGIKKQDLLEQYHRYYVIDLAIDQSRTLMIPVSNAEEIGLRSISQQTVLSQVWHTLCAAARTLSGDYRKRQKRIQEKLKTGDVIRVAEVIRDLAALKREDHLTSYDTQLLERAQQFLSSEVALVEGVQVSEAERMISETLDNGLESPGAQGEEAAEESTARKIDQPALTSRRIRQLARQAMKRLHPG